MEGASLLSLHATTAVAERNWSGWGRIYKNALCNWLSVSTACEADEQESAEVALGTV